jgi:tetratricopeptide (TPR) repeat protein
LEAAYASLLWRKRRVLHRRVAEALERCYPEQVASRLGVLAHHWERAGDADRAVDYLKRAGRRSAAQYANAEAVDYLTRALALVAEDDPETRYELLLARERLCYLLGDHRARQQDLVQLEALAERLQDPRKQAEVAIRWAEEAGTIHQVVKQRESAEKAVRLARALGDAELEARAYIVLAHAWSEPGAPSDRTLDHVQRALDLVQAEEAGPLEAEALHSAGAQLAREQTPAAREILQRALRLYREAGDRMGEGRVLHTLTISHQALGEYEEGRQLALHTLDLVQEIGDRPREGSLWISLGYQAACLGRYSEALNYLAKARAILKAIGDTVYESNAITWQGIVFDSLGRYRSARERFEEARAFPMARTGLFSRMVMLTHMALLGLHQGEVEDARERAQRTHDYLDDAGALATHGWLPYVRRNAHILLGHALTRFGDDGGAIGAYHAALAVEQRAGPPGSASEARAGLARLHLRRGETDRALAEVQQILDYLETGDVNGTLEPLRIYLTCYRVLDAVDDPRACEILAEGHRLMMERASHIDDEDLQRSYLENVATNREIAAAYHALPHR